VKFISTAQQWQLTKSFFICTQLQSKAPPLVYIILEAGL